MAAKPLKQKYRTIWISDTHLGTRGCKAAFLHDFLKHHDCDFLYLVGDIVDLWRTRRNWYWQQSHNNVIQAILKKAKHGTSVIYVPGNHDEGARHYCNIEFGEIHFMLEAVHTTADGRRLLVIHGDEFDGIVKYAKWLAVLGDMAYNLALTLNHWFNVLRDRFGYKYWSLSAYLKDRVKNAVEYISQYENSLSEEARRRGFDGVVCGHIHRAEIRDMDGILYCNDGDWVESCTALVEHYDGRLEIIQWVEPDFVSAGLSPKEVRRKKRKKDKKPAATSDSGDSGEAPISGPEEIPVPLARHHPAPLGTES